MKLILTSVCLWLDFTNCMAVCLTIYCNVISELIKVIIIHHLYSLITIPDTLTVLILAVSRTPVTYELTLMTLLSMSSHSSVDRASTQSSGGHGLDS